MTAHLLPAGLCLKDMKTNLALLLTLLFSATFSSPAGVLTGPITNSSNGHIYYLLTQTNWVAAEQEAKNMGGHLATISDAAEQLWVYSTFSAWGGIYRALLIGLNDRQVEGSFGWANGAAITYTNWNLGEPNDGNGFRHENAVHMYAPNQTAPGKWNDFVEIDISAGSAAQFAPFHGVVEIEPLRIQIQVSQVAISWNSTSDINYQVQYASSLTTNVWTNLGAPVQGNGSNSVVVDSVLDQSKKFYRVINVP